MVILGIDPGLSCGWAVLGIDGLHQSGVWGLRNGRHSGAGMAYVNLRRNLAQLRLSLSKSIDVVAYEEVTRHMAKSKSGRLSFCVDSAHIYGGIVATIQAWCHDNNISYTGIPVGTIKRHATGKGNAPKAMMVAAAQARWSPMLKNDNECDALWIADCAMKMYGKQ